MNRGERRDPSKGSGGKKRPGRSKKNETGKTPWPPEPAQRKRTPAPKDAPGAAAPGSSRVATSKRSRVPLVDAEKAVAVAEIRDPGPPEQEALVTLLQRYGVSSDGPWHRGRAIKVVARRDLEPQRRVVLVTSALLAVADPFAPQLVGLPIAYLTRKGGRLTLEGARWLAPLVTKRFVTVSPKGETLFLYGRTLLRRSVQKVEGPVRDGDEVLVLRASDQQCLGVGIVKPPLLGRPQPDNANAVAVTNRMDLGQYLRDAQDVLE